MRETVKFRTYIDALAFAQKQKQVIYNERAEREKEKEEREARKKARLEEEARAKGESLSPALEEKTKKVSIEV